MASTSTTEDLHVAHEAHVKAAGYASFNLEYETDDLGTTTTSHCDDCPYVERVCMHTRNTWHDKDGNVADGVNDGHTLVCNKCGMDVT